MDWDDGSHGSSEEDDFEEEDETPIAPVSIIMCVGLVVALWQWVMSLI